MLKLDLENFKHYFASVWDECNCAQNVGLPWWLSWERLHLQCGRPGFNPWIGKIPWRRERLPTPVLWPGKFHGLYSLWGHKELDTTEQPSLALPFFGIGMKTDLFQSCGHCWVFQICSHIECSTFTASSFRIWNSSSGIPSPPLALFVEILSKTLLTSHSRMSGSRWEITPSWLSGSWNIFCTGLLCILATSS